MARGSIRKHERANGVRYEVVVDFGYDPATGKRRQRSKSFKTRREAQAALAAWLADIDKGAAVDRSTKTVAEVMAYWIETHARPRLRAKTVGDYENIIKNHILPELGGIPVQRLTPDRLLTLYARKTAAGVGPRTLRLCHVLLRQALRQAATIGLVSRNVADVVSSPKGQRPEMHVWDTAQAQAKAFLSVADQSNYGPLWIVALATGMRRGEVLGLRWQDVDIAQGALYVRQTVGVARGRIEFKPPKTRSSTRTVHVGAEVIAALQEHRRRQNERRLRLGEAWQDHNLVFTVANGNPIHPDNLQHDYRRLVRLAGVPYIRIHDLRHTFVTLAYQSGASIKAISEMIGHANIGITLDIYMHVLPEQRIEVSIKVSALLFGPQTR